MTSTFWTGLVVSMILFSITVTLSLRFLTLSINCFPYLFITFNSTFFGNPSGISKYTFFPVITTYNLPVFFSTRISGLTYSTSVMYINDFDNYRLTDDNLFPLPQMPQCQFRHLFGRNFI